MTALNRHIREYPISRFHWDTKTGTLTAEASDLSHNWPFSHLYLDACDIGFAIAGHRSTEMFYVDREIRNDDDLLGWELSPVNRHCRAKKVVIFND